jgi:hypothetical protein
VYPQGPFSDAGHEFVVTAAPTTPALVTLSTVQAAKNKRHQVTQITLQFSGAVNATEADSVAIYRLVMAGKKGSFTAKNARLIRLHSAVYDPSTNTVTLTVRKAFARSKAVQLTINGMPGIGLQDSVGRLIDGNHDGQAGGNAVAVLTKSQLIVM